MKHLCSFFFVLILFSVFSAPAAADVLEGTSEANNTIELIFNEEDVLSESRVDWLRDNSSYSSTYLDKLENAAESGESYFYSVTAKIIGRFSSVKSAVFDIYGSGTLSPIQTDADGKTYTALLNIYETYEDMSDDFPDDRDVDVSVEFNDGTSDEFEVRMPLYSSADFPPHVSLSLTSGAPPVNFTTLAYAYHADIDYYSLRAETVTDQAYQWNYKSLTSDTEVIDELESLDLDEETVFFIKVTAYDREGNGGEGYAFASTTKLQYDNTEDADDDDDDGENGDDDGEETNTRPHESWPFEDDSGGCVSDPGGSPAGGLVLLLVAAAGLLLRRRIGRHP